MEEEGPYTTNKCLEHSCIPGFSSASPPRFHPIPHRCLITRRDALIKSKLAVPQTTQPAPPTFQKLQKDLKSLASRFTSSQNKQHQANSQLQKTLSDMKTHATAAQRAATSAEATEKRMWKYQKISEDHGKRLDVLQSTSEKHKQALTQFRSAHVSMATDIARVATKTKSALKHHAKNLDDWVQSFRQQHLVIDNKLDLWESHISDHIDTLIDAKFEPFANRMKANMQFSVEYTDKTTNDTTKLMMDWFDALSSQMTALFATPHHTSQALTLTPPKTLALTSPTASKRSHDTSTLTDTVSIAPPLPEKLQKKAARQSSRLAAAPDYDPEDDPGEFQL